MTSAREARACFEAGAARVELCRSLDVGGLTPERAAIDGTVAVGGGPVVVLVRPTARSFRLDAREASELVEAVARVVTTGAEGVVVGALDATGRVDRALLAELTDAAAGRAVTFHRAFDEVAEPLREAEALVDAGVARVLTSGGGDTAWEGRAVLGALVRETRGRLTVLAGGRVRAHHVRRLVDETGLEEVHARGSAVPELVAALRGRGGSGP